jgi:hypothetical protein
MSNPAPQLTKSVFLDVPLHSQDAPGYCSLGCASMLRDAFGRLTRTHRHSQYEAYKDNYHKIYRGDGAYDRWHLTPKQTAKVLSMPKWGNKPTIQYERTSSDPNQAQALGERIQFCLEHGFPCVALVGYDAGTAAALRSSGTHWMVVNGISVRRRKLQGYYMSDPWRGWYDQKSVERTDHTHGPDSHAQPDLPHIIAVWQRALHRMGHTAAQPSTDGARQYQAANEADKLIVGGIQTNGLAYVITPKFSKAGNPKPAAAKLPNLYENVHPRVITKKKSAARSRDGVVVNPTDDGSDDTPPIGTRTLPPGLADVPGSWEPWLSDPLASDVAAVPTIFANALPAWEDPITHQIARIWGHGSGYQLEVFPKEGDGTQLIAWRSRNAAGELILQGVAVVRHWPDFDVERILNNLSGPDGASPADTNVFVGIPWIKKLEDLLAKTTRYAPKKNPPKQLIKLEAVGLVWKPCTVSLTPVLPLLQIKFTLPKELACSCKPRVIHAAVELNGRVHFQLLHSSKAGA